LEQARQGFAKDDPKEFNEAINNNVQRASAIINELSQSLNMSAGGTFAARMRSLYDYFDRLLHESNMTKTEPGINEVLKHVTVLRDSWAEMLQRGPDQPADSSEAAPSRASGQDRVPAADQARP